MPREAIWQLVKITLLGLLTILLIVRVWQADALEERWLDVRDALDRQGQEIEGMSSQLDDLEREVKSGVSIAAGTETTRKDGTGAAAATGTAAGADPRTLPYWKTADNILVDLADEPRPPEGAPRGGIIRYYTGSNPRALNVHVVNEAELQERICGPVYEYVAEQSRADPDHWVPGICNRVTVNDDFTVFDLYVRKGVFWHKPYLTRAERRGRLAWLDKLPRQEVTAKDVKFTFDVVKDPLSECGSGSSYLVDLESVEVVSRYVVSVKWKRSLYYNLGTTLGLLMIYPRFIYTRDENGRPLEEGQVASTFPQHWFNNKMCGTGPFQFAGWEPNQFLRLRRNPDWWNPNRPAIDGIDLRIVSDRSKQLELFKAREIDVISVQASDYRAEILEDGPGSVKEMIQRGEVLMKKWEAFAYYYVGWNLRLPQFREKKVRHALAYLYPKERIIRDVVYGLATPHNGPVHRWASYYVPDTGIFPYDPARAAALLDEAGWKMGPAGVREKVVDGQKVELRFKMLYPASSTTFRDATLLYQKSAAKVGVLIEPNPREWGVMTKMLDDKDFEASMLGWGNAWDSDPSQIWHSDSARAAKGSNYVSYISPRVDAIIEGLKTTFEKKRRQELWREFQTVIEEDQPYCFTFITTRVWFINSRLGNPVFSKLRPQDWFLPWYVKRKE